MSDSVRPHRRQPTRLLCLWDSPGKNTGVGCHFLLQCMKVKSESEVAQSCPTLSNPMDCMQPTRLLHPWDFPGKSTGVGRHCLLCFIQLIRTDSNVFLFMAEYCYIVYMYHNFFIHSSVNGHLGCFHVLLLLLLLSRVSHVHVLAIANSAAMNNGIHVSLSIWFPQGI